MDKTLKDDASRIANHAISAVDPVLSIKRLVEKENNILTIDDRKYNLKNYNNIYIVAFGKASVPMAKALEDILVNKITEGIALTKYGYGNSQQLKNMPVFEAGHPVPDENSVMGAKKIKQMLEKTEDNDLVLFLISGGGSSLLTLPRNNIKLADVMEVTRLLLRAGATIKEVNTIRKHLSDVKGGGLARLTHPAESVSLIISDVVGDPLDVIASGPTVPDISTFKDFKYIVNKYKLVLPESVKNLLVDGLEGRIEDTPKPNDPMFNRCHHHLIGNNSLALSKAQKKASELGYHTLVLTSYITGEAREIAKFFAAVAKEEKTKGQPVTTPACILAGGETTVTVTGDGKGGRCQEFALSFALDVSGMENIKLLATGTDGTDGPTDAAGAFADGTTLARGNDLELDPESMLSQNNSYPFFEKINDLFITGPTGTNVMDVYIILIT